MKKISTLSGMLLLCTAAAFAQRPVDLELTLVSPGDGTYIPPMQPFTIEVSFTNVGTENFNATDSVAYYLLFNGDTLTFQPQNENHANHTGFSLLPGASHTLSSMMFFDNSFEGMDLDLCVYLKPFNAADPIADPELSDNLDCATVHVMEEPSAGLDEAGQERIVLSPNPATDVIAVQSSGMVQSLAIRNASGQLVKEVQSGFAAIDCSGLENGVYFFSVATVNGTQTQRVVIAH